MYPPSRCLGARGRPRRELGVAHARQAEDDPAGDDRPDVTLAPAMIAAIRALGGKDEV